MGGGDGPGAPLGERPKRGARQRSPFRRIGAAPDLVDQDQGGGVGRGERLPQDRHVGAEGREVGADRLVVADIGDDPPEHRQLAPRAERRHHAALRQLGSEAHGLQEHGLAAGVRPADQQGPLRVAQLQVEGHHRGSPAEQQRVAGIPQHQPAARLPDHRGLPVDCVGVARPRPEIVGRNAHGVGGAERLRLRATELGQVTQHLQRFPLRLDQGRPQGVPQLDRGRRLDEQGGLGGRLVVHDAVGPGAGIAPDRDHIPVATNGDLGPGRNRLRLEVAQHGLQLLDQPVPGDVYLAPGRGQPGAGGVQQLADVVQRIAESSVEPLGRQWNPEGGRGGSPFRQPLQLARDHPRGSEGGPHRRQLGPGADAAGHAQPVHHSGQLGNRWDVQALPSVAKVQHLRHHSELGPDPKGIAGSLACPDPSGA